ncbi:MAG: DUF6607 family protein [Bacteroidota bacterium]
MVLHSTHGQTKPGQDRVAILGLRGCYAVTFNFAEILAAVDSYEFMDNYRAKGLEWAELGG